MKKRTVSLLLALCMLFMTVGTLIAYADDETQVKLTSITAPSDYTTTQYYTSASEVIKKLPTKLSSMTENGSVSLPCSWNFSGSFDSAPSAKNSFIWTADTLIFDADNVKTSGEITVTNKSITSLTSVTVSGLSAPVAGKIASNPSLSTTTGCNATSFKWLNEDGTDFSGEFLLKKVYKAEITLTSTSPFYQFSKALKPSVSAGTSEKGVVSGEGSSNTLTFTVTFPETKTTSSTTSIDGNYGKTKVYTITVKQPENGEISPRTTSVTKGSTLTFTITPNEGYEVNDVTVDGESVGATTSYKMENISKSVILRAEMKLKTSSNEEDDEPNTEFADVGDDVWYKDSVKYVAENSIMMGVTDNEFAPDNTTSRAMVVSILYRIAGSPEVTTQSTFDDVAEDAWYASAVSWAAENKIATGSNGMFYPDTEITRQDLASMIYRYIKTAGKSSTCKISTLHNYDDGDKVDSYAKYGMAWCIKNSVIYGDSSNALNPKSPATRAEVAAIIERLCKLA